MINRPGGRKLTDEGKPTYSLKSPIAYETPDEKTNLTLELIDCFKSKQDTTLLLDSQSGSKWTGSQILDATTRVACQLAKQNHLAVKSNILIICDQSERALIVALGAILAGCSFYPQNPEDGMEEIKTICKIIEVHAIATNTRHHQLARELRKSLPNLNGAPIIWVDDQLTNDGLIDPNNYINNNCDPSYAREMIEQDGVILLDDILHSGEGDLEFIERRAKEEIDVFETACYFTLTSGSTGYPKVVETSQWGVLNSIRILVKSATTPWDSITGERLLYMSSKTIVAGDLPMDHGACIAMMLMMLNLGGKYVVIPSGDVEATLQAIHDYKINTSINGPTHLFKVFQRLKQEAQPSGNNEERRSGLDLSSLTHVTSVGAKVDFGQLIRECKELYPNLNFNQSYGFTEIGYVANLPTSEANRHIDSVGYLLAGMEGRVVDDLDRDLGPNERGQFMIKSVTRMKRYHCRAGIDSAKVWADCFTDDGFYRSGDSVHYDEEGRLYIHGRIKETLTLEGEWKILPAELEAIVNEHPIVDQSVIVGVEHPELPSIQVPRAFVKLLTKDSIKYKRYLDSQDVHNRGRLNLDIDKETICSDIYQFAAGKTAVAKHLRGGVIILDDFPRNGSLQKIDKKKLRAM